MTRKSLIITGATGYIGSHLLPTLLEDGWHVSAIVRSDSNKEQVNRLKKEIPVILYDFDLKPLVENMRQVRPRIVVHLASNYLSAHSTDDIDSLIQGNILYSTHLLQAMLEAGVQKFVNTSSFTQHRKDHTFQPFSLYASTKQAFEAIIDYYAQMRNFQVITLELFDTFGPADLRPKFLNALLKACERDSELSTSPGHQKIDLVYIDDVITAYQKAINVLLDDKISGHQKYAVSSGNEYSLREIAKRVEHLAGKPIGVRWGVLPYRNGEIMAPWNKRERLPNWEPEVSLEEGIRRILFYEKGDN